MKARLAGAQKGHGLLKKKADALQMRFRQILGKIIEVWFAKNNNNNHPVITSKLWPNLCNLAEDL